MKKWLTCLFFGHLWELRSHPADEAHWLRAAWEDWHVCTRCGKDSRQTWEIEDDQEIRLERVQMEIMRRKL